MDYRKLNAVTVRISYLLPRIQDILEWVFYMSMDLVSTWAVISAQCFPSGRRGSRNRGPRLDGTYT